MRLELQHVRPRCSRGVREFCKLNQLDYAKFVREGIEFDELRALNNPILNKIIDEVEKRGR